ncbi:MAG: helix-turn-helix domain-containing protein [Bacteroidaceae bacterium]|nr:helix-turn-helix domain-containing protein [Bacteroidaceae bacterium]
MKQKLLILIVLCMMWFVPTMSQTGHFISADRFSNSIITDLCQDKYGNIWIATDYGLNKFDGYEFTSYLHEVNEENSLCNNAVVDLLCDREGNLWVGTNRGLDRYDPESDSFVHYPFPNGYRPRVPCLVQRSDGELLVCTSGYGAYLVSDNQELVSTMDYTPEADEPYYDDVYEDSKGRFWRVSLAENAIILLADKSFSKFESTVGTPLAFIERADELLVIGFDGIMSYRNGQMTDAGMDLSVLGKGDVRFNAACADSDGNIYIGTRAKGLFCIPVGGRSLERVDVDVLGVNLNTAKVTAILFDREGNLWLGLQRKGLLLVSKQNQFFRTWSFERQQIQLGSFITSVCEGDNGMTWCTVQNVGVYGFDANGLIVSRPDSPSSVEFIYRDKQKRYWLGTDKYLYAYNPHTGKAQQKLTLDGEKINEMTADGEGNLYISTFARGFCSYNTRTGEVEHYSMMNHNEELGQLCNDWILCMTSDYNGMIWMGTSHGVSCFDPKTKSFLTQGWLQLLNGVMCFSICELRDGNIAIGTDQGLYRYDRKQGTCELFPDSEQLSNKIINYIVQSNDGDLWCATSNGIWQYSSEHQRFFGHVNGNGLEKKEYLHGVGTHTDADLIYFGHNDGLVSFSPKQPQGGDATSDELMLTSFMVGGVPVNATTVLNDVRVTEKPVSESDLFTLSHHDHAIMMSFSQMDFANPANVQFEYRVNGGEWVKNVEGKNTLMLNLLHPGVYDIGVRSLQGNVYSQVKNVSVVVRAPWYRTVWAYTVYVLLVLCLGVYVFVTYRRHVADKLNEDKMKFLINCTHDIRSPLTLILSPLANLKRRIDSSQFDALRDIDTIERNANRVLNLVNQILDVRKMDKQQMKLYCQETDMVRFIFGIYKMYEYNAGERNIKFFFRHDGIEKLDVWFDRSQFDKVMSNLLSNAFKYSYDGGTVEIVLSCDESNVRIQVIDTGVGLDKDNLKRIFDRFYQGGNSRRMHINGTGIGLNLCKMIVDMHRGTIEAQNRTDGQRGSIFTLTLPLGKSHLAEESIVHEKEDTAKVVKTGRRLQHSVLVVDDDLEIAHYISTELGQFYKFGICANGKEGLKELLTNEYDLVISDVMMPEMDGFTMLRMIKSNINVAHIPVIMLTSKADIGGRLEGLERGADAFLAKPFNMEELHMNIENLIAGRQRLKGKYSGAQEQVDKVEHKEVKGNDEILMERIMKAINKNLSDSSFNVDMLTSEVGISRAQLHRKMKEMTGISTSEFIRNIRLEQAARLLREQKINVTQVAYTVGFSNLAHFSTIFRKHFGVSPSEFVGSEQ